MSALRSPSKASFSAQEVSADSPTVNLLQTPPSVLHLLTHAAPYLKTMTAVVQAMTWSHPNLWLSALILSLFWIVTLYGHLLLRYALNGLLLIALAVGWISRRLLASPLRPARSNREMTPEKLKLVTEDARTLSIAIEGFVNKVITPMYELTTWQDPSKSMAVAAYLITSYPFYLLLTYYCGVRPMLLSIGTLIFLWPAHWFQVIVRNLSKSLIIRTGARLLSSFALGGGRHTIGAFAALRQLQAMMIMDVWSDTQVVGPPLNQPATAFKDDLDDDQERVLFTFTIFENQRWWLGIEWSQALLPNERPPWCDSSLKSVDPPSSFLLPVPQTVLVPASQHGHGPKQIKRTSTWRWVDADWRVVPDFRSSEPIQASAASTVDMSKTKAATNAAVQPSAAALADWARNKANLASSSARKTSELPASPSKRSSISSVDMADVQALHNLPRIEDQAPILPQAAALDELVNWTVDQEGWQYGDNGFEKMTSKAGLGKYTRRRAWQRRAEVVEQSEPVLETPDTELRKRARQQ